MKRVPFAPGVDSTVLGFGCASVMGAWDRQTSERAIRAALDAGIRHFDLAPSYGFGEAEGVVGDCLRGHREQVVLVTKYGIAPTALARLAAPLKPIVRRLRTLRAPKAPSGTRTSPSTDRLLKHVPITAKGLAKSVERSLRRLRTDWLDAVLLHEPPAPCPAFADVLAEAQRLKETGKVRAFGIACYRRDLSLHQAAWTACDVLQTEAPADGAWSAPPGWHRPPSAFFSLMAIRNDGETAADAVKRVHRQFPATVLLFSSRHPERIAEHAFRLNLGRSTASTLN